MRRLALALLLLLAACKTDGNRGVACMSDSRCRFIKGRKPKYDRCECDLSAPLEVFKR